MAGSTTYATNMMIAALVGALALETGAPEPAVDRYVTSALGWCSPTTCSAPVSPPFAPLSAAMK